MLKISYLKYFSKGLVLTALLSNLAILSSCSKRYQNLPAFVGIPFEDSANYSVGRFKTSYMADQIHAYFRGNIAAPIAVTTFVDIDNLYQSSTFGRILAEQLISELSMKGYNVLEIRLSDAVQILEHEGELGLSRDTNTLRSEQEIAGLVVGTYASSSDRVYINARLINPATARIISVSSVEMAKSDEIAQLVRGNSLPSSLERIPVRHLAFKQSELPYSAFPQVPTMSLPETELPPAALNLNDDTFEAESHAKKNHKAESPKARLSNYPLYEDGVINLR